MNKSTIKKEEETMTDITVMKVHSFTTKITGGNPAGVVLDPFEGINGTEMKKISSILKVSETAFVFPSKQADMKIRFFSPTIEVDLCGHATIATFYCIAKRQPNKHEGIIAYTQETKAGILPVHISIGSNDSIEKVMMRQAPFKSIPKNISYSSLAKALRINEELIDKTLPIQAVSTGLFTLPICVSSYDSLSEMNPDFDQVLTICKKHHVGSFHVFTYETIEPNSLYHARNFAPYYGINEDPVTGTANGAVCSYLKANKVFSEDEVMVEQGDISNHSGRVMVQLKNESVYVGGKAVIVEEKTISI